MPLIKSNGIEIFYDEFGEPERPTVLLIMGLGTQMLAWSELFCTLLASSGLRVIRYDNRDVGLSSRMEGAPKVNVGWAMAKAWLGLKVWSPYSLEDMAADAVGLLDALGVERAHTVGASMGGMIAQIVAANHPQRALSLTSIMSTSGRRGLPGPQPAARAVLTAKRPTGASEETLVNFSMGILRAIGSPAFPTPEDDLRDYVRTVLRRSYYPPGFIRQLLAILANGSRVELLKSIRMPTLVLHGEADPLLPVENGRDTARCISGARLETIPGWGHDLPPVLAPRLARVIAEHCLKATAVA